MDLDGFSYMKVMDRNKEKNIQTCSCHSLYGGGGGHSMASCPAAASLSLLFPLRPSLRSSSCSSLNNSTRELDEDKSVDAFLSVDCTLSLRTPTAHQTMAASSHAGNVVSSSACPSTLASSTSSNSKLCWTALQSKQQKLQINGVHVCSLGVSPSLQRCGTTAGGRGCSNKVGTDSLSVRRCANCDTTSTPLWRNGPRGPKSLCNACGIRHKKEERRAIVTTERNDQNDYPSPWSYTTQLHSHPTEYQLVNNGDHEAEMVARGQKKCLSWRLNLSPEFPAGDRTNLVGDMT